MKVLIVGLVLLGLVGCENPSVKDEEWRRYQERQQAYELEYKRLELQQEKLRAMIELCREFLAKGEFNKSTSCGFGN